MNGSDRMITDPDQLIKHLSSILQGSAVKNGDPTGLSSQAALTEAMSIAEKLVGFAPGQYPILVERYGIRFWLERFTQYGTGRDQIAAMVWFSGRWRIIDECPVDVGKLREAMQLSPCGGLKEDPQ